MKILIISVRKEFNPQKLSPLFIMCFETEIVKVKVWIVKVKRGGWDHQIKICFQSTPITIIKLYFRQKLTLKTAKIDLQLKLKFLGKQNFQHISN